MAVQRAARSINAIFCQQCYIFPAAEVIVLRRVRNVEATVAIYTAIIGERERANLVVHLAAIFLYNWRAGASQPSRTAGSDFYIYRYIGKYLY